MKAIKTNGLTTDIRYAEQQSLINAVAKEIGCIVFRPDYHGLKRDGNTVLVYFPEDDDHNRRVEQETIHYGSADEARMYGCTDERYYFRPPFWTFENTDANGWLTFDFANGGRLDLRHRGATAIEGSMKLAYYRARQSQYTVFRGGYLGICEADDSYNDYNCKIIQALAMEHGYCYLGHFNASGEEEMIYHLYHNGDPVELFGYDFAIREPDEKLTKFILAWLSNTGSVLDITERLDQIGGELFCWY